MLTENFAKSMQQNLAVDPDKEQVTKAEGLDSMTGELEDQELEAVAGGIQTITVSGPAPDYIANLSKNRDMIATRYGNLVRNAGWTW